MHFFRNRPVQAARVCLVLVCLAIWISAQATATDKTFLSLVEKNIQAGKLAEIENDLFKYVIANPKDAKGFSLLARLRLKQNRLNEARSLSQKALTLEPTLVSAKLSLASADLQLGEAEQARAVLGSIAENEITDNSIRLSVAEMFESAGDCPTALKTAAKLPEKIRNSSALPFLASCYLQLDDKAVLTLISIAKTTAKQDPTDTVKFAAVLSKHGFHNVVVDLLRLVVGADQGNVPALLLLAKSEIYLKDFPKAAVHLALAEKLRPGTSELLFVKAILESEQGNNARSLELLEASLAADPNNIEILRQFVVTAIRANQPAKAVRAAETLIARKPDDLDHQYLYGAALLQNNNLPKAEAALAKYLEMRPTDSRGCLALGLTFAAQAERLQEARQQLQKCLAIDPNDHESAYQLGLSYKTQGDSAKAIEYLELAARLRPENASVLRDLGDVYLQSGAEGKARPVLEKAVMLDPNNADAHFQLSRLYNIIGERDLAKKHLEIFQKLKSPKKDGM